MNREFTKYVKNDKYEIRFDSKDGYEELEGINGNPDPFVLDYPTLIDVGIMGNCQNKCEFCYQGDKYQDHMTVENFRKLVNEVKNYVNQCALGGRGNPNKHPNFREIIEICRDNNIIPNYTTSGLDLTDEEVEISKKCGAVAVSMHEKDYTWRAVKMFQEAGIMTNIHFVFSSKSFETACKILLGFDPWNGNVDLNKLHAVIFLLFKPQGRGKNLLHWIPSKEELKTFCHLLTNYKRSYILDQKTNTISKLHYFNFDVGADSCLINKVKKLEISLTEEQEQCVDTCEGARMSCYITPDMKLAPCSFGDHDICGESILNKSFKEVWDNGVDFIRFRDVLKNNPARCPFEL